MTTKSRWPEPIAAGAAGAAVLTELWARAERVDAAVADDRPLRELAGADGARGKPRGVRVVTCSPPPFEPAPGWRWVRVATRPVPEFMLFYAAGSSFPECAIVHAGRSSADGWFTVHRRPFILNRLRERFDALIAIEARHPHMLASSPLAAAFTGSVREETAPARCDAVLEAVSPTEVYRRVLAVHLANADRGRDGDGGHCSRGDFSLAAHQQRAFERACDVLDRYGGVIVADSVGLGKTYIGLRLLERTLDHGGRTLVIVPAALKPQWQRELAVLRAGYRPTHPLSASHRQDADFAQHDAKGRSGPSGSPGDETLDLWVREEPVDHLRLLSLESLGRRGFDASAHQGSDLVLVDEAHNFRNPATRRYRNLSEIVRHSKLVMLTATPINNSILDLRHLIDLFAPPGAFRHLGIPDYREAFRRAAAGEGDVQAIVAACVVRRTRRFVRRHYPAITIRDPLSGREHDLRFPEREPPVAVEYDLAGTYGDVFSQMPEWLDQLRFPVVDPTPGLGRERDDSMQATDIDTDIDTDGAPHASAELLKIILLKRLESSVTAFRCTVIQQLAWCRTALNAITAGRVLSRPDYRAAFRGPADDPGSQLAFFELMLPAPAIDERRLARLRRSLEHDQAILAHIHAALSTVGSGADLKLRRLLALLDGPHAGRKTLIFTEFRDTARYLYHQLRDRPHVAQIDSGGARLGLDPARRRDVIQRFAPRSNGFPEPPARERVDLLIATDVLSEGLNLQDATAVISYDLPWNPVRLMQRSGRIDRLGSVADSIALHHFVPARDLERLLGLMGRLQRKLRTIQQTLGLDHPVLAGSVTGDRALDQIRAFAHDPGSFDQLEGEMEGPLDPEEQAYIDGAELLGQAEGPSEIEAERSDAVAVSRVADERREGAGAIAYWRLESDSSSRALWLVYDHDTNRVVEDQASALAAFRRALDADFSAPSDDMIEAARQACTRYARGVAARLEAARIAGDALSPGLPQCRIAAWLNRAYQASARRLTPQERQAIDRLHARLARRFKIAAERSLAGLAGELPEKFDPSVLARLEDTLESLDADRWAPIRVREVALLLVTRTV